MTELLTPSFEPLARKMEKEGLSPQEIDRFRGEFTRFVGGETGSLSEEDIAAPEDLTRLSDLNGSKSGATPDLERLVVIKLNGGLGTSMGLAGPKGAITVKQGLSFLAIVAQQTRHLQDLHRARLPLILMNSFATREESLEIMARYPLASDVTQDFLQSKVPKLEADGLKPVSYPADPELEWCPPGHGEIYSAMRASGLLEELLQRGYRYAFVSNVDNLGATVDPRILSWFVRSGLDFAMEVTRRTEQDRKGGHLARLRSDKLLVLREVAQCPKNQLAYFEDIQRYQYFNTNNLWLNLVTLGRIPPPSLPLIVNRKTVNPAEKNSTPVIQLESAMGAAIACFQRSEAIEVDRSRFIPVKNTANLLRLSSDLYQLDASFHLHFQGTGDGPRISLDDRFYRNFSDWRRRFPEPPGLLECRSLDIQGDVAFTGPGPVFQGEVSLRAETGPVHLAGPGPFEGKIQLNA